jgi:5,6-dimethylbenzimidazole synthase
MPETIRYSVVAAIQTLWLAARAEGLGVGWVSILDPSTIADVLDVPGEWSLVAYLCVGYPEEEHLDPELERRGWQAREDSARVVLQR